MKTPTEQLAIANTLFRAATKELADVSAPINERIRAAVQARELALQAGMAELTGVKVGARHISDGIEYEVEYFICADNGPMGCVPSMPVDVEQVGIRSRRILKDGTKGNSCSYAAAKHVITAVKVYRR